MTWEQFLAEGDYAVTVIRNSAVIHTMLIHNNTKACKVGQPPEDLGWYERD